MSAASFKASGLLEQDITNPCRRAFGFGHSISYTGITVLPLVVATALLATPAGPVVLTSAFICSAVPIVAGIVGAIIRNAGKRNENYSTIPTYRSVDVEYAAFAAAQDQNCHRPVRSSLTAGLRNSRFKNGLGYTYQAAAWTMIILSGAAEGAARYVWDMGRALMRERNGQDPSMATSKTFENYFDNRTEVAGAFLERNNLLLPITVREQHEARTQITTIIVANRRLSAPQAA